MASVIVIAVVILNALGGAGAVAKVQSLVIRLVIVVLLGLAVVTMATADWSLLAPSTYPPVRTIIGQHRADLLRLPRVRCRQLHRERPQERERSGTSHLHRAGDRNDHLRWNLPGRIRAADARAGHCRRTDGHRPGGEARSGDGGLLDRRDHGDAVHGRAPSTRRRIRRRAFSSSLARQGVFPPMFGAKAGRFPVSLLFTSGPDPPPGVVVRSERYRVARKRCGAAHLPGDHRSGTSGSARRRARVS